MGWTYDGERPHATIGYEADLTEPESAWLRLHYPANGEPVNYTIQLATTTPHYGGLRWWFTGGLSLERFHTRVIRLDQFGR